MKSSSFAIASILLSWPAAFAAPPIARDTSIHHLSDRRVIIERMPSITLADPPEPVARPEPRSETAERLAELAAEWRGHRISHPSIHGGAKVYLLRDGRIVTHVTQWRVNNGPLVSFWSSADFSLLAHPGTFSSSDEEIHYRMMLMWTPYDVELWADFRAKRGLARVDPKIPEFPAGPATWLLESSGSPDPEPIDEQTRAAIEDIHDHYNRHRTALQADKIALDAERAVRRAELEANPPQPRDIHLRVSRLTPVQAAAWYLHATEAKGGDQ
jgi:hypothetical protein